MPSSSSKPGLVAAVFLIVSPGHAIGLLRPARARARPRRGQFSRSGWILLVMLMAALVLTGCEIAPLAATATSAPGPEPLASPSPSPLAAIDASTPAPPPSPTDLSTPTSASTPTALPSATAVPSPTTPPTPVPERMLIMASGGQGVNMRRDPGTTSPVVKSLRDGAEVTIVGPDRQVDGRIWRNVQEGDAVGWVVSTALRAPATPTVTPSATATQPATSTPDVTPTSTRTAEPTVVSTNPPGATPESGATPAPAGAAGLAHAEVFGTGSQGANLRADPGLNGRIVQTVADGTQLTVIGDDREAGGRTWRNVRTESGSEGWVVAEAVRTIDTPTVAPGPTETPAPPPTALSSTSTPSATATSAGTGTPSATAMIGATGTPATSGTPTPSSPGTPPPPPGPDATSPADQPPEGTSETELTPEPERVEVFDAGTQGANLRRDPGNRGFVMRTVPDGSQWTIIGPDQDVDGRTWRNVQGEDGTTGWLAAEVVRTLATPTPTPRPGAPGIGAPTIEDDVADDLSDAERAAMPCRPGQIKGDAATGLYFVPEHPDYAGLRLRVRCFDSQTQARASGYDPADDAPTPTPAGG